MESKDDQMIPRCVFEHFNRADISHFKFCSLFSKVKSSSQLIALQAEQNPKRDAGAVGVICC